MLDCAACDLQNAAFAPIIEEIRAFIDENAISVYNEETNSGLVRHIYLRVGEKTGELMLCMVLCGEKLPREDEFVKRVTEKFPAIKSLYVNTNEKETNVVLGDRYRLLYGKEYITDILCGVKLMITPQSFYQVNRDAAELLYQKAASLAGFTGDELLLDLYCGIGSIGLSMANKVKKLIGIEVVPSAIECAKKNAKACGIDNAEFFCADASSTDNLFDGAGISGSLDGDIVIFDPPRKGSSEKLINYVCGKHSLRVGYISCNPDTLARDSVYFINNGYMPSDVTPFDLFPRTGHCECVMCFEKQTMDRI